MQDVGMDALDLLNIDQAARRMNLSPKTVSRMCLRGELDSIKAGRRRLIPPSAIAAWIAAKFAGQPGHAA